MTRRNVTWLVVIVVVGVAVGALVGWLWGVLAAVATLVVSEVLERTRRARIRRERGADVPRARVRDVITSRRRR